MHLSYIASTVTMICALPLSLAFAVDRSEDSPGNHARTGLGRRDGVKYSGDFLNTLGKSDPCGHPKPDMGECIVGYLIDIRTKTRSKNKTPIEIATYLRPCSGGINNNLRLNHGNDKFHSLKEDFDFSTKAAGLATHKDIDNITLSIKAYGDLKGPAHPPVIKIGDEELVLTSVTLLPDDLERPGDRDMIMWAAAYTCNNE